MTNLGQLTDRDLLVRIDTKLELLEPQLKVLESKVLSLELSAAKNRGAFDAARMVWGLILALPAGVVGAVVQAYR